MAHAFLQTCSQELTRSAPKKKVKAITNFYLLVSAPQSQKVWKPLQRIIKGQKKNQQ